MPDTPYRLAIVIPARDEQERLPGTLRAIAADRRLLAGRYAVVRLLVADNGSRDATAAVATELGAALGLPLEVLSCPVPGKAAALVEAMPRAAGPDVDGVLFMDADNATPLAALAAFEPADGSLWIASRHAPGARILRPAGDGLARRLMSRAMRDLTRLLVGLPVSDTQCGFKLVPSPAVAPLFGTLRSRSWVFDVELLAIAAAAGIRLREAPVTWTEVPGSKVSPVADALRSLRALVAIAIDLRRDGRRRAEGVSRAIGVPPPVR